jgi:hypothetical protein
MLDTAERLPVYRPRPAIPRIADARSRPGDQEQFSPLNGRASGNGRLDPDGSPRSPMEALTEAELSRIWAAQSFPPEALTLVDGRPLRVVLPGRPGGGSGPDYLDAIVAVNGIEQRGDVELHVRASGFRAHGHDADPAYDNVVLHVVYEADDGSETLLHSGACVPVAAFAPWVGRRREQLQGWLAAAPLWREPCADAASRLGRHGVLATLGEAGRGRLVLKSERLRETIAAEGEEQALWAALLDCLGVGPDRAAWRRLSARLPAARLRALVRALAGFEAQDVVQAALLATAGHASAPAELEALLPLPLPSPLRGGSRPASRPDLRLRALAALWSRAGGDLPGFARRSVAESASAARLTAAWTVPAPDGGPALLGRGRARELLLNVVLPFASLDPVSEDRALRLSAALPAAPVYGKTAFLVENLRRSDPGLRAQTALEQQGLLAMVSDWCRQGGCGRCPLS